MNFKQALQGSGFVDQGTMAMNALVFGAGAHPNVVNFIRNQAIPAAYARLGSEVVQAIQSNVKNFMGAGHRAMVEELESSLKTQIGEWMRIENISQAQLASPTMIRVVMANPTIASMYDQGLIKGYGEIYDRPKHIGLTDPMYCAIVTDMAIHEEGEWSIAHVYCNKNHHGAVEDRDNDDDDDDTGLTFTQKTHAIESWKTVLKLIAEGGQDPTSPTGEML